MSAAALLSPQARQALRRARRHFAPARRMSVREWAETHRRMHSGPRAGNLFEIDETPALAGILAAYQDPLVREVWCQKSAQIGWTQGFVMNVMGYHVHLDPCPILVLFAKEGATKRFMREKLEPAIRASRVLLDRIPLEARSPSNTQDYKGFTGGFIQLVGSNSPTNVKSTDARVVIVEEPDDTSKNVAGQGDSIAMGRERYKSYPNGKMIVGGTPTVRGLSKIEAGMLKTDQRRMYVECPHCGHEQTLRFEQLRWQQDALVHHPVYGTHRPDTARYACEACGVDGQEHLFWTDDQKNQAVLAASKRPDHGYRATAAFSGIAGFYTNELYSTFAGSRFEYFAQKWLEAKHAMDLGDDSLMRSFKNNQLGETFELKSDAPEIADLVDRGEDYAEWTVPAEALVATAFVDVQRGGEASGEARLEYLIVAWGRGEESWRVARGVALGNPMDTATWDELDRQLAKPIRNAAGGVLPLTALGVDSGDGMTQEAVYRYCRARSMDARDVIPTKGASKRGKPIYSPPRALDHTHNDRASRWGLKLYLIGTESAKDTIAARLKLQGRGDGRMHWPAAIGTDYLEQITAEVKIPGRNGEELWSCRAGRRNEMLDCEVGNLHLARKLRLHSMPEHYWRELEAQIRQPDLLGQAEQASTFPDGSAASASAPPNATAAQRIGGARPFSGFGGR